MKKFLPLFLLLSMSIILITGCKKEEAYIPPAAPVVNAGTSTSIRLPLNQVDFAGTGMSDGGKIVGYLWSLVSGPNAPTIASPSSPNTSVTGLISGDYLFQFLVIDDQGLTGVDTLSVKVLPSEIMTLSLQPKNNYDEVILFGDRYGSGNVQNNSTEMGAASWTKNGVDFIIRTALRFDLSTIPSNATIISAKLSLYSTPNPKNGDQVNANSGTSNEMLIQRITSSWNISNISWTKQPTTTTDDMIAIPSTNLPFLDLIDRDVSKMVAEMIKSNNNNGFWFQLNNEVIYKSRLFSTSYHADASKHPKLKVEYQVR